MAAWLEHPGRYPVGERSVSASAARTIALRVVTRVRTRRAWAHETLDAVLNAAQGLDTRDRALATRLAYGVIATSGTLDEALDRFVDRPNRIEPRVRDALRIAAWELLFGEVQPHVAVSEGVELVRSVRPNAASLTNAVLRRLAEASADFPWGDAATDTSALARLWAHPEWLTELLLADLGRACAETVLEADNAPAPLYLALLAPPVEMPTVLKELDAAGAEPRTGPLPGSLEVGKPAALMGSAVLGSGRAEVCDAGAQFAAHTVRPRPGQRIVDIGAGRGTKTLLLQALAHVAGGAAEIWAVDSKPFKLDILAKRAQEAHVPGIRTLNADATDLPFGDGLPEQGQTDAVLLDAPCSGLGTLRRHPDKRWRVQRSDIEALAELSAALLAEAAMLVRPGGFVVYSTCTLTKRENQYVVNEFLAGAEGSGFALDDLSAEVPAHWSRFVDAEGWFQSIPEIGGPDGHFVARIRRR